MLVPHSPALITLPPSAHARWSKRLTTLRAKSALAPSPALSAAAIRAQLNDPLERQAEYERLQRPPTGSGEGASAAILRAVCEEAASIIGVERVTLFIVMDIDRDIRPDWLGRLSLMLNEIMINTLRHAHPTGVGVVIDVWCRYAANGDLVIDVTDDGVGLPDDFDAAKDGAFGFALMRTLAHELGATLRFESGPLGLATRVRLPA